MNFPLEFEQKLESYIGEHALCTANDNILVAVSGGVDSVVLSYLLYKLGYKIGIAHCNFDLRMDSKKDLHFVKMIADAWDAPFFQKTFPTKTFAKQNKMGIQEAARDLRYRWFNDIMIEKGYTLLATAHHFDDQIETVFINMSRGAGINGLGGMKPKRNQIIRPLLAFSKEDIQCYASMIKLPFREDASNRSNKYRRNFFRNRIIPKIEKKIPGFKKRMGENILIWQKSARLLEGFLAQQLLQIKELPDGTQILDSDKLETSLKDMICFEWLRPFGFNYSQTTLMGQVLQKNESGRQFYSKNYRVIIDRKKLILSEIAPGEIENVKIDQEQPSVNLPDGRLDIKLFAGMPESFPLTLDIEYVAAAKLTFPLTIRRWQAGDFFFPIGMHGKKQKVKKYFTNEKVSLFEKESQWVLTSDDDIVWLVGRRLDHRFRIGKKTSYYYRIRWTPNY